MEKMLKDNLVKFFEDSWWNEEKIFREIKELFLVEKKARFQEEFLKDLERIIKVYGKNALGYSDEVVNSIDILDIAASIKMRLDGANEKIREEKKKEF